MQPGQAQRYFGDDRSAVQRAYEFHAFLLFAALLRKKGEARKQFFFEKKNQKTFAPEVPHRVTIRVITRSGTKVFCFFFSKKKYFLTLP